MSAVSALWGDIAGKGNNVMDIDDGYVYKQCISVMPSAEIRGKTITFLASSLDFTKELRIFYRIFYGNRVYEDKRAGCDIYMYNINVL